MSQVRNKRFRIVCGYDFSELSELALDRAISMALSQPHADLHVIGVLDDARGLGRLTPTEHVNYQRAEEVQEEITNVIVAKLDPPSIADLHLFVHARIGTPAEQILNLAAEAGADAIVIGTHGRRGLQRWLIGSVAERVVRYAECPVVVVRPTAYVVGSPSAFAPEPPCPACLEARAESDQTVWWCERHSKEYVKPHRYHYNQQIVQPRTNVAVLW